MRYARTALAIAIALWGLAFAGALLSPIMPAVDRLDGLHRTVIGAAITATLARLMYASRGRRADGGDVSYRAGYLAGRAEERQSARRVRTLQADDIDATVVGGDQPFSDATLQLIREVRQGARR